ncbi:MAG: ribulokinase [Armatimonadetes bacterium]|nr:MAG: ribulokinase [Armatimonadota bacterium]
MSRYSVGLDFGTGSVRAIAVDLESGATVAAAEEPYETLESPQEPELARQNPLDYLRAMETGLKRLVQDSSVAPEEVAGIGIAATASTPLPVLEDGAPLAAQESFANDPNAMAWLWKDHTAHAEAEWITERARELRPEFLARCGGSYSSEWFWAKVWHCARVAPRIVEAAYTWMELCDWIPGVLTGAGSRVSRSVCAAGHKGLYASEWGGYPDVEFLDALDPQLARLRGTLPAEARPAGWKAGELSRAWAERTGLPEGTPVSVGAIDAHLGAVGAGVAEGVLVRVMGTSACDMAVGRMTEQVPEIPGISGIVRDSIVPGWIGFEAGQAAVGDLFAWWTRMTDQDHRALTERAAGLKPGETGLLALDWNNGNRSVLQDPRLTGLLLGATLATSPAEVYRALVEATAFGARVIWDRLASGGVRVGEVVACGGIAEESDFVLQTYADATGRTIFRTSATDATALGAAIAGAVAGGAYSDFESAMQACSGKKTDAFRPRVEAQRVYDELYELYLTLHDAFGGVRADAPLADVMKRLLRLRDEARQA